MNTMLTNKEPFIIYWLFMEICFYQNSWGYAFVLAKSLGGGGSIFFNKIFTIRIRIRITLFYIEFKTTIIAYFENCVYKSLFGGI